MKFGIMNLFPLGDQTGKQQVITDTIEEIELADQLGFDSAWLAEHHFSEYGILGNPLTMAAAVAQRTTRIIIGTAVAVIPLYDPMRLAEDGALVDILSGGRLVLGMGRGYQPREFAGFGRTLEDSFDLYRETVDLLKLAWSTEGFSYHGTKYHYDDMTVYPRPLTPGGPPMLHGTVSPDTFRSRGLAGDSIITSPNFTPLGLMKRNFDAYRTALVEGGHPVDRYELPFMQQVWCGRDAAGKTDAAQAALNYYRSVGKVIPGSSEALAQEKDYYEKVRRNIDVLTLEQTLTHGGNFGSVNEVVDNLGRLRDELGVTHYIGWFRIPTLARTAALKAMEVFATDVIPQLADKAPVATTA